MTSMLSEDTHIYIDTSQDGWIEDMMFSCPRTPATLVVSELQTQGTVWVDRHNQRVVMHPRDRIKLMREAMQGYLGNPMEWFERAE